MSNNYKFYDNTICFRLISYNELVDVDYLQSTLIIKEDVEKVERYNLIANNCGNDYILITVNDKNFLIDLLKEIRIKASELCGEYNNGIKEFYIKDNVNKLSKTDKWLNKQVIIIS